MLKRKKGICKQSRDNRRQKAAQHKAYAAADDAEQAWCSACGKPGPTDHAHLFTQGRWEQHRNTPLNWVRLCRKCHRLQEDNKNVFAAEYPQIWAQMVKQMEAVDPQALKEFGLKNSHLLPARSY
jgi:hypothetical protein